MKDISHFDWHTSDISNALCCFCGKGFTEQNTGVLLCLGDKKKSRTDIYVSHNICLKLGSDSDRSIDSKNFKTKPFIKLKGVSEK